MVKKLNEYEITSRDGPFINADCNAKIINTLVRKINELVDIVNTHEEQLFGLSCRLYELMMQNTTISKKEKVEKPAKNIQPDYVTTTYVTNGHTKEYYGQKGASIVTNYTPLPAGYVITIREPETKGGDK